MYNVKFNYKEYEDKELELPKVEQFKRYDWHQMEETALYSFGMYYRITQISLTKIRRTFRAKMTPHYLNTLMCLWVCLHFCRFKDKRVSHTTFMRNMYLHKDTASPIWDQLLWLRNHSFIHIITQPAPRGGKRDINYLYLTPKGGIVADLVRESCRETIANFPRNLP